VLQRFFANLNGSMKLLRSERPGIMFFAKVVQLLALKCGTGLMFPEKNCCIHRPKRIRKLYDFNIVDGELKRTQNVVVPGSEAADGMWQKNMLTMNQTTGKTIIQLILHYVLFIRTFGAA